jgi:hypothetical protein
MSRPLIYLEVSVEGCEENMSLRIILNPFEIDAETLPSTMGIDKKPLVP